MPVLVLLLILGHVCDYFGVLTHLITFYSKHISLLGYPSPGLFSGQYISVQEPSHLLSHILHRR